KIAEQQTNFKPKPNKKILINELSILTCRHRLSTLNLCDILSENPKKNILDQLYKLFQYEIDLPIIPWHRDIDLFNCPLQNELDSLLNNFYCLSYHNFGYGSTQNSARLWESRYCLKLLTNEDKLLIETSGILESWQ